MKKQLFYFLFFVCVLIPSVAIADFYLDFSIDGDTYFVSPIDSVNFTLEVRKDGSPVSGQAVIFSVSPDDGIASLSTTSATTDSNGKAQTTLSLSGDYLSETVYQVTAKLANGKGNVPQWGLPSVVMSDGAYLRLYVSQNKNPRPGDSIHFTFSLDKKSGLSVRGRTVTFSVSPDNGTASLSTTSATTGDYGGGARTTLVLGSNASGRYSVTATLDDGKSISRSTPRVYNPKLSEFIFNMRIPSGALPLNPGESRTFIAYVEKDLKYISGRTVTFSVKPDDGTVSLSPTTATTDSDGQASTVLTTGSDSSGLYTVTATLDNGATISGTATVEASSPEVIQPQPDPQPNNPTPAPTLDSPDLEAQLQGQPQSKPPPNNAPEFTEGTSTRRSVVENTASGQNIGNAVSATDTDNDALTYTLGGTDAAAFSIVSTTGQLQTKAALDYETKASYTVTVAVSDGNGGSDSITITISVTDVHEPPLQDPPPQDPPPQDPPVQEPQGQSEPEQNWTIIPFDYERDGVGKVVFSEIMLSGLGKYPQWIELYNTTDQDININGWKIVGRYLDDSNTINILESQVISKSWTIEGKGTVLIVGFAIPNSRDRISIGLADKTYALQSTSNNLWNYEGFVLELQDAEGNPIDRIGNLNAENDIVWAIPMVVREKRTSLIRRLRSTRTKEYNFSFGIKEFGWFPADEVERLAKGRSQSYYGRLTDIGSPGYRTEGGEILPVTLSQFNPRINQDDSVVISWITESEVDNAGFNILRSNSKKGLFVRVNPKLIQGAGTTGERNAYTWIDTAAKPNIEYYYQIEDVSFAGIKQTLATQRLKGIHTAKNRALTSWGIVKQDPNK
ncbi:MAG: cadherin domain-containing protein [Candidatus Poribacteria bacterium]|nr:cadherin domain-containing protein [Candidatus Poribacteria bacterium]